MKPIKVGGCLCVRIEEGGAAGRTPSWGSWIGRGGGGVQACSPSKAGGGGQCSECKQGSVKPTRCVSNTIQGGGG